MTDPEDTGKVLLEKAESNLKSAISSFDPYAAGEKPAFLTAIANVYKMLYELHGETTDPVSPEEVLETLKKQGLKIVPIGESSQPLDNQTSAV